MSELQTITLPAATVRYRLDGPAGPSLDMLVATLIGAGIGVEAIKPASAYRLDAGSAYAGQKTLDALGDQLQALEGFALAIERPPSDIVHSTIDLAPAFAPRRTVTVHGIGPAFAQVARAVDRRLTVATVGLNRWAVTARSAALVAWLSEVWVKTPEEVLEYLQTTPEQIAAEDRPPASVSVALPDRRTETEVLARDGEGQIARVVHIERSLP